MHCRGRGTHELYFSLYQWVWLGGGLAWSCFRRPRVSRRILAIAARCFAFSAPVEIRHGHHTALERAHRSQSASLLVNPKTPEMVIQAGRHLGWLRLIAIVRVGFFAR